MKRQLNEIRESFYVGSRDVLGVDITGIVLPHTDTGIQTYFGKEPPKQAVYEYLEPTAFDRQASDAAHEKTQELPPSANPKIYQKMAQFMRHASRYLDVRIAHAQGDMGGSLETAEKVLRNALADVKKAALIPPFPEAKAFTGYLAKQAEVAHHIITHDRAVTREVAEMQLEARSPKRG